jgi:hypothetical protein
MHLGVFLFYMKARKCLECSNLDDIGSDKSVNRNANHRGQNVAYTRRVQMEENYELARNSDTNVTE